MPITYRNNFATFNGVAAIDDAEELFAWLSARPKARLQLARCSHLHAAVLQLLIAFPRPVKSWPRDELLRAWLEAALPPAPLTDNKE